MRCKALAFALLLASAAVSHAQTQSTPTKSRRRSSRGGSSSSSGGPDLDAGARRVLPCPKGFVAEKAEGSHLVVADKAQGKPAKGRKKSKAADDDAKAGVKTHTLARRCVPDPSLAKPAKDDGAKDRRTAAEALRD